MNDVNDAERVLKIMKDIYQSAVSNKRCKVCKCHDLAPRVQDGTITGSFYFCKKKMDVCPPEMQCNDFEVIQ